ncbi:MAG: CHAT domain-containing protein [Oscillatoria sp. PMC 1068.18]|nr:CHAT domain-containing protein [Oscillatoria sp. PMC 1076.18]MEC4988518.1 CHAT domain-containing protein [Oscillatoria sp. PMC 1068.18]
MVAILGFSFSLSLHNWQPLQATPATSVSSSLCHAQTPATNLIQLGKQSYEMGRFADAVNCWEQALLAHSEDFVKQAQISSQLSLAYQQMGEWEKAEKAIARSLSLLDSLPKENERTRAQALNTQGHLLLATGNPAKAFETWQQAEKLYAKIDYQKSVIGSQINQVTALYALGHYNRAENLLVEIEKNIDQVSDSSLKVYYLQSYGQLLEKLGKTENLKLSPTDIKIKLQKLAELAEPGLQKSLILISLGNLSQNLDKNNLETALTYYEKAEQEINQTLAQYPERAEINERIKLTKIQAQLNQLDLLLGMKKWAEAEKIKIAEPLEKLTATRPSIYAQIKLAQNQYCLAQKQADCLKQSESKGEQLKEQIHSQKIIQLLETAVAKAKEIKDQRAESFALGTLGRIFEKIGKNSEAELLTKNALNIAQSIVAPDLAYQWEWQLGRLLLQEKETEEALSAYSAAVKSLQEIRGELVTLSRDKQFDFRDDVEAVYRKTVDLLIKFADSYEEGSENNQKRLKEAREVIELLQLAELDNFFANSCVQVQPQNLDQTINEVKSTVALVYTIFLEDRLEVIFSQTGQFLRHYSTNKPSPGGFQTYIELLLSKIGKEADIKRPESDIEIIKERSQKIYEWLLPSRAELHNNQVNTLVFILDGDLRNIPLAVLYDGEEYLIQNYQLVVTPGLQLLPPQSLDVENIKALAAGRSDFENNPEFTNLQAVKDELSNIQTQIPAEIMLNDTFIGENMQKKLNSLAFSILHIATHGVFSSQAENTYIIDWNGKITLNQLGSLLRVEDSSKLRDIQLLILSACQTAEGNNRVILGMAGMALQVGARSIIATLWNVNDESTALLMAKFYQELKNNPTNKAESLRRAQLELLEGKWEHPYYWSPFVLVGNWL